MASKVKVADKLKKEMQDMILKNMRPGDKLPTESELCIRFEASRTSVREALQALRSSGILEKKGGGTYVTDTFDECLISPLMAMLQLNLTEAGDLLEIRRILETETAGLAAKRATEEDIHQLENIVWMMQKPDITLEEFIDLDIKFHMAVAQASGNSGLQILIKNITSALEKVYPRYCTLEIAENSAIPLEREIVQAISHHDYETAKQKMARHLLESGLSAGLDGQEAESQYGEE